MGRHKKVVINESDVAVIKEETTEVITNSEHDNLVEARDLAIKKLESEIGEGIIFSHSKENLQNRPIYSTGILSIDRVISKKSFGIPAGRIIELYGEQSSGKTTLALQLAAEINRNNGMVMYVDLEGKLDLGLAKAIGVQVDSVLFDISIPEDGEQALKIVEEMVRANVYQLIIIDSVAAISTTKETTEGIDSNEMGGVPRLMGKALRTYVGMMRRIENKTLLLFINQVRSGMAKFGSFNTTPGGKALKFFSAVRLEVKVTEKLTNSEGVIYGQRVNVKAVKNQVDYPYYETDVLLRFGEGFDKISDIIRMACDLSIIEKAGAWFKYGERKIQGEENLKQFVIENNFVEELTQKVKELLHALH